MFRLNPESTMVVQSATHGVALHPHLLSLVWIPPYTMQMHHVLHMCAFATIASSAARCTQPTSFYC